MSEVLETPTRRPVGRPRKPEHERLCESVSFLVTQKEGAYIDKKARESGLTVSAWLRRQCKTQRVFP